MNHKQEAGQDGIPWREKLRNLADDADIEYMDTSDLLCVIYVTGIREKLLEVQNPTIAKFDRVVNSFDQAKKQLNQIKPQAQASQVFTQRWRPKQSTKPSHLDEQRTRREASVQRSRGQPSREEQMKRDKLFEKCFRCGKADHMLPDCTRPAHLSCGTCEKKGHAKLACSGASANNTASQEQSDDFHQITNDLHGMSLKSASADIYNKQDE